MIDALQLMAMRGIRPIHIERSSDRPGATGHVLSFGRLYPLPQASDVVSSPASRTPVDPVVEAGRVSQAGRG